MSYKLIKVEEKFAGEVSEITLGPAPANIISNQLMDEVNCELEKLNSDKNKKLIIFRGEGKHFSFGASVAEHAPRQVNDMLPGFHRFISNILNSSVPILSQVRGCCLGGGFEIALATHFIFCDELARFAVPEISLSVFPPVACLLLAEKIGDSLAQEMILTGRNFSAEELKYSNLCNGVYAVDELEKRVNKFIESNILTKSSAALRITTRAARMSLSQKYSSFIKPLEELYLKDLMSTADAVEGINSFLEKRQPNWSNS